MIDLPPGELEAEAAAPDVSPFPDVALQHPVKCRPKSPLRPVIVMGHVLGRGPLGILPEPQPASLTLNSDLALTQPKLQSAIVLSPDSARCRTNIEPPPRSVDLSGCELFGGALTLRLPSLSLSLNTPQTSDRPLDLPLILADRLLA